MACLNKGEPPSIPVEGHPPASNNDRPSPAQKAEPWPTDSAGNHLPVKLHVPEGDRLDHGPTASEIAAALQSLGDVQVLAVRPNEQVDRMSADELAALGQRHAPEAPTWRTARGRVVDLAACSTIDLHRALEGLERDTCMDGGCRPGEPCRRHTRRKRG